MTNELNRANLLQQLQSTWADLQTFLAAHTEAQLTSLTDAVGWTVKDHLIHLALWEGAGLALLDGKPKWETFDMTPEIWDQDDDPINAVLYERYRHLSLAEVMQMIRQTHEAVLKKLSSMTDADLALPYSHFQPQSNETRPIIRWLSSDSVEHYLEHMGWLTKIVNK